MSVEKSPQRSVLEERENDRNRLFEKFFSKTAREGYDIEDGAETRHVKGWYERFPVLTHQEIDEVVYRHEHKAVKSKLVSFSGAFIEGDLGRASVKVRKQRVLQAKYEVKESKKELDTEKVQLKKERKVYRKIKKRLKSFKKDVFP